MDYQTVEGLGGCREKSCELLVDADRVVQTQWLWVSGLPGHLRMQCDEASKVNSLKTLVYTHEGCLDKKIRVGSVDWKLTFYSGLQEGGDPLHSNQQRQ